MGDDVFDSVRGHFYPLPHLWSCSSVASNPIGIGKAERSNPPGTSRITSWLIWTGTAQVSVPSFCARYRDNNMKKASVTKMLPLLLGLLALGTGIWFFLHERQELPGIYAQLQTSHTAWLLTGGLLSGAFLALQGLMYRHSFRAVGAELGVLDGCILYLKRNLAGVFLVGGGLVSQAMFARDAERQGASRSQVHFATSIHFINGIASLTALIAPVLLVLLLRKGLSGGELLGFVWLAGAVGLLTWLVGSLRRGGLALRWLLGWAPGLAEVMADFRQHPFSPREAARVFIASLGVEAVGIAHLWIAMQALGIGGDWWAAMVGYSISMLVMMASPFLRGAGAVEAVLAVTLARFGLSMPEALAVSLLFRFFEFWLVLAVGAMAFLRGTSGFVLRIAPPIFVFALGVVNVISSVTPALHSRLQILHEFLPLDWIHYSNFLVLTAGLALLLSAAYLWRGMEAAWWVAAVMTTISILGHLGKGIDWEEAILGLTVLSALLATRRQYFIRVDRHKSLRGLTLFGFTLLAAFGYGVLGFYFLDRHYFNTDFTLAQSARYTLELFFLLQPANLQPATSFAGHFMTSIAVAGMAALLTGLYYFLLPHLVRVTPTESDFADARRLVEQYGRSSLDYFKTYFDKNLFFTADRRAFLAYKIARNYAVVLEDAVAPNSMTARLAGREFNVFCRQNGLRPLYYRIQGENLEHFHQLGMKSVFIGQEAVVDLGPFSLEGKSAKSLRNALSKAQREGYMFRVIEPPVKSGILQKVKAVSDAWLEEGRRETGFSSGVFDSDELHTHTLLVVEDSGERVVAFANLVPDAIPGEATYDLIRRLPEAPSWVMDFLMVNLFLLLQSRGIQRVNLGLAPMSGFESAQSLPERAIKFAADRFRTFAHYKSLRAFKDKYATRWENRYLAYTGDFDLLQAPVALWAVGKI